MPFVDENGVYNDVAFALDTHNAAKEDPSIFESLIQFPIYAPPLIGLSVVNSFVNTAIDIGNFFGLDNERIKVEDEIGENAFTDYYRKHQFGIEAAGLVLGSLIPGTLAVKGATASVKATALARAGYSTETLTQATGLLAPFKARILETATNEIRAGSTAIFGNLNATKLKLFALGAADQSMQAVIYELATAATMKASPLLDKDSLSDVLINATSGAVIGGVVGGTIEGIIMNKTLNKMLLTADMDTKLQEVTTRLGIGNFTPGDHAAVVLNSIMDIPEATNLLGSKKRAAAIDSALLAARKILNKSVKPGDEALTNGLLDVMWEGIRSGAFGKEEIYDRLARLTKVSRLGEEGSVPTGEAFYINRFVQGEGAAALDKVITKFPDPTADVSRRFRLKPGATDVKIHRADEVIELPDGRTYPRFGSAKEAFDAGADIYLGVRGAVSVNPKAPNIEGRVPRPGEARVLSTKEEQVYRKTNNLPEDSKPLYSEPIVLNLDTKALSTREKLIPTVGDLAEPTSTKDGLLVGDRFFAQAKSAAITATTDPLDANARYTWAAMRGIQPGDIIDAYDIPMLEALYHGFDTAKGNFKAYLGNFAKRGVKFPENVSWSSPEELATFIKTQKDRLIADIYDPQYKLDMSLSGVARVANVKESYILGGQSADDASEYLINANRYKLPTHVQLEYDISNMLVEELGNIPKGSLDVQYRVQLAKDAARAASAEYFGENFSKFDIGYSATQAGIQGPGPGLVTSSNSAYNSLGQRVENVGRAVAEHARALDSEHATLLMPHVEAIKADKELAAEVGNFIAVRRRTGEEYVFLPKAFAAKYWRNENTVVLKKSLVYDDKGRLVGWNPSYTPPGFLPAAAKVDANVIRNSTELHTFYDLSPRAAAFEQANMKINDERIAARNKWYAAQGIVKEFGEGTLYAPPIDTGKYKYFFFVRARPGTAFADTTPSVVTAATEAELTRKASAMSDDFQVIYKRDIKEFQEAMADYSYDRNFSKTYVNSELKRRGVLNDVFPDINPESIARDYADYHSRSNLRITRDYLELTNAQLFAELRAMGNRFTAAETSKVGFVSALLGKNAPNPYNDYINVAMNITDKSKYPLWADANEKLESLASSAFTIARNAFLAAKKGHIPYEEASKISERFGLGNPYARATDAMQAYEEFANRMPPQKYLSKWVSTTHAILSATAIRLDAFQSLINAVSTPILALSEAQSAIRAGKEAITIPLTTEGGHNIRIPGVIKLISSAVVNYVQGGTEAEMLKPLFTRIGALRGPVELQRSMIADLALPMGNFSETAFAQKMSSAVDKASKLAGAELSEEFSRYVPAYMAYKIFGKDGYGYSGQQLYDNIVTFVNRVQGNYTAAQRPLLFQGPLGASMSLFQTYQFNLMQQVFRYVENKEWKSLALLAGMQTTLFGMQGLPGFQLINNHIVGNAANNPEHKDIYSTLPQLFDKRLGEFILYGSVSNLLNAGLYSRGDINPRNITVLPINPMDFPAVVAAKRFTEALWGTSAMIAHGGSIPSSMLLGLEHNGLSRPLAGLAQLIQGHVTTGGGKLVATTTGPGYEDLFQIANFSRLAGARPLDEAIIMDAMYRKTLYQAADTTRIASLGEAIKSRLYNNGALTPEMIRDFGAKYAQAGGDITKFSQRVLDWTRDANSSVANEIYRHLKSGPMQQLQVIMGGRRLPDYRDPQYLGNPGLPPGTRLAPDGQQYAPNPGGDGWMRVLTGGSP